MMSRMLGAPLGGTTRGGHHGVESLALSLITPPNGIGGGGSCFPSSVIVALGAPGTPLICWARAAGAVNNQARVKATASDTLIPIRRFVLTIRYPLSRSSSCNCKWSQEVHKSPGCHCSKAGIRLAEVEADSSRTDCSR